VTNRDAGDPFGPAHQALFGLGRSEAAELDHFVDPELACIERP
jgi:hypothetical protein